MRAPRAPARRLRTITAVDEYERTYTIECVKRDGAWYRRKTQGLRVGESPMPDKEVGHAFKDIFEDEAEKWRDAAVEADMWSSKKAYAQRKVSESEASAKEWHAFAHAGEGGTGR